MSKTNFIKIKKTIRVPSNCPNCNGEREWVEPGKIAQCYFCGKIRKT